jgi:hypothetical protein
MPLRWEWVLRASVAVACATVFIALGRPPPKADGRVTLEVVPNSAVLRVLARSQLDFVADLFWIRMGNMASRAVTAQECGALLPLANLIADLSPGFKYPYFVGGVLAPVRRGRTKEYDNAEGAVALMSRGVANVSWGRLHLQKAFTELEMLHDPVKAGNTLLAFAREPGAPSFVGPLATRLLAQGGHFEAAREFARSMAQSEDPQVHADGEARLRQIDLEELLVGVDAAVEKFTAREGHPPASVAALVEAGFLPAIPVDPLGGHIELSPDGARSSTTALRFRPFIPMGAD